MARISRLVADLEHAWQALTPEQREETRRQIAALLEGLRFLDDVPAVALALKSAAIEAVMVWVQPFGSKARKIAKLRDAVQGCAELAAHVLPKLDEWTAENAALSEGE